MIKQLKAIRLAIKDIRSMWVEAGCTWKEFFQYFIQHRKRELFLLISVVIGTCLLLYYC